MRKKNKIFKICLLPSISLLGISLFTISCNYENNKKDNISKKTLDSKIQSSSQETKNNNQTQNNFSDVIDQKNKLPESKPEEKKPLVDSELSSQKITPEKNQNISLEKLKKDHSLKTEIEDSKKLKDSSTETTDTNPIKLDNQKNSENNPDNKISNQVEIPKEIPKVTVNPSFYPTQRNDEFKEQNFSYDEIKKRILSAKELSSNYYSHPNFRLKENFVTLKGDNKDSKQLELVSSINNEKIKDVKWYIRTSYPTDEVYKPGDSTPEEVKIEISNDGKVIGKEYDGNDKTFEIWAEYKGYLFKALVRVLSKTEIINEYETVEAFKKAKEIAAEWKHLSHYQKALKAYEWMTSNVRYRDDDRIDDYTAYSALVKFEGVCTAYSKGYKMLLDELGITSFLIYGRIPYSNGKTISHVWNLVEIEGKWYHVDCTWGAKKFEDGSQTTIYEYFLIKDEDFAKGRTINNPLDLSLIGDKYRFSKIDRFVATNKDIERHIEKWYSQQPEHPWINFRTYHKFNKDYEFENAIFKKLGVRHKNHYDSAYGNSSPVWINENVKIYSYILENIPTKTKIKNHLNLTVEKFQNNKSLNILKIKTPSDLELGFENIWIQNAFIDRIEKTDDGYLVYLTNFDKIGKNLIHIEIFKIAHKFNLNKKSFEFEIKQQQKPNAFFIGTSKNSGILKNVDNTMQYRTWKNDIISSWKDIDSSEVKINNIDVTNIQIRKKSNITHIDSEIQVINLVKNNLIEKEIKVYNHEIIGVNQEMQYRLKDTENWININTYRLSNLKSGTYEIRVKPGKNSLASDSIEINI
ncbi:MAG6410 family transglutaminase-related lipoprotein [Metamycoplasma canadense]|uniref:Transglutaminase-like domain-containing protein n=1 Tax=Metamycoplasma canadense TaxID=29554 RepID=A0A077LBK8_9BACT|nr:transglutaminase domain-containing protein [Metamycoplasma canadense]BAP39514.1 hypothetical protein MCAN360_0313 [Metamycoplasma canadense]